MSPASWFVHKMERLCHKTEHRFQPLCRWVRSQDWWWDDDDSEVEVSRLHQWSRWGVNGSVVHDDGTLTESGAPERAEGP